MTAPPASPSAADRLGETVRLAKGVRLTRDEARGCWVLQAPERVFVLDDIAYEVIRRCDGRPIGAVIDELARTFEAGKDEIATDVLALIDDLRAKGVIAG
jgi:coenzyme PQQ biosynthesis protein PqqD